MTQNSREISWAMDNSEFNTHRIYWRQEGQGKTASKLLNERVWMDGSKRTKNEREMVKEFISAKKQNDWKVWRNTIAVEKENRK